MSLSYLKMNLVGGAVFMDSKVDYICALTNLYGHVSPDKACEVYNQQNDTLFDAVHFTVFLTGLAYLVENRYIYVKNGQFLEETNYLFQEKYEQLCMQQTGKPHYVPEKEQLMNYVNLTYWEKPLEYEELETYILAEYFTDHGVKGKQLADEIFNYIMEDNFQAALDTLVHYEITLTDEKATDPLLNILQRLNNNTRMRVHNSFTPIEISKLLGESVYILPDKLLEDENDCHCGSKKKYKICHMEDDNKIRRLSEYRI